MEEHGNALGVIIHGITVVTLVKEEAEGGQIVNIDDITGQESQNYPVSVTNL